MGHVRRIAFALVIFAVGLVVASAASAQSSPQGGPRFVPPAGTWDGMAAGDLMEELWYRVYTLPVEEGPFGDNGDRCMRLGRTGGILFPANAPRERPCIVERGTPVFINGLSTAWSSFEDPFPRDEATQQALSLASDESAAASIVTIDGRGALDVRKARYGVFGPQRVGKLPRDNIFGLPPQAFTVSSHGWMVFVLDLPVGLHAIQSYNTFTDGSEPYVFTKFVKVVQR